jgi:16S rRNA C967 or C1407 C5-methylase (RsmB/RsmF family)/NOL1/NOP2/fmu family ribosome biogenesis protein
LTPHLPAELIRSLSKLDHFDPKAFQSVHESGDQLVSVHMNPGKPILQNGSWPKEIKESPFDISYAVPWAEDAYYLASRPSFTLDPLFHAGLYYVQEASGMFVSFAIKKTTDLTRNLRILDLCAAPGGKSTMLQSLISEESLLVSNEVIKSRVPVLYQNMTKWGFANGIITNNDPIHFKKLPGFFDIILIDAPCSGSGLFRKDPEAAKNWNMDLVQICSQRQRRILADTWESLKEDGLLIYSTCSYSKEENEDILDMIFQQYPCISINLSPDPSWNIVETKSEISGAYGYRFYPDKVLGEGFFLSVIQKKQAVSYIRKTKLSRNPGRVSSSIEKQICSWVDEKSLNYIFVGESIHALPDTILYEFETLKNNLYLKKAGIRIGKRGENELIPDHELALANFLKYDSSYLDVSKSDSLSFLRGEPFESNSGGKGWKAVSYMGRRMGWVKMIEKRMNNYYPKSWRIRQ